ncbi:MAG TPA: MBOAT family O-acyltransferase [Pirellulales bacterium]|nr:MBOAT family O-acyltransferase [Pirellulales bacterium]
MSFVELRFFLFAAVVFAVHWSLGHNDARKAWLLAVSYVFYGAWDWRFLSLIALSTGLDFLLARQIACAAGQRRRRRLLVVSLAVNLGLLGVFKYFNFFAASAADLSRLLGFAVHERSLAIVLPVGISFYTFQSLSYVVDVHRKQIAATNSLLDFALYVAFFPQLVAGPIVRAGDFLPQLATLRRFGAVRLRPALWLFLVGFFKKACVSDNLSTYVDLYFAAPGDFDAASACLGVLLYAVQIYCDFSGYSEMGIASAALLGYRLCENFRHPYLAPNLSEFWRRWHISLSNWLRDYVYVPLGGNRRGRWRTSANVLATMFLGGLWHGAAWTFVLWGTLHGLALIVQRAVTAWSGGFKRYGRPATVLGTLLTCQWVAATWVLFRAPDLRSAGLVLEAYLGFVSHGASSLPGVLWLHLACLALAHYLSCRADLYGWASRVSPSLFATLYGSSVAACLCLLPSGHRPFIYFQF